MCEHCKKSGIVSVEEYDADDQELCEYMEEPEDLEQYEDELLMCEKKAQYLVVETTVEDHLCAEHVKEAQAEGADADLFAESIGLGTSTILPVDSEYSGVCEYFDPLNPNPEQCRQKVTQARILEFETLYCKNHLKEYQAELES